MKALIIGGGIAGATTALFLQRIGINPYVFEASNGQVQLGAGLNIAPNGMRVLNELGLLERVINTGSVVDKAVFWNSRANRLASVSLTNIKKYDFPAVNIKRVDLNELLLSELRHQQIEINFNKKLQEILIGQNSVTAIFVDGTSYSADLLIGADGVGSKTRQFVTNIPVTPFFTGIIGSGGLIEKEKLSKLSNQQMKNLNFVYGKNGFFGYGAVNDRELMWWTNIISEHPYPRWELKNFDKQEEIRLLTRQYGMYTFPVSQIISNADSYARVNVYDIPSLPNWSKGNVCLVGDAAHAVSPNSGQGASLALEDAMLLAKLIRDNASLDLAFQQFELLRRPRVEKIVREGRKKGEDKLVVNSFKQFIRENMIRIFVNLFGDTGNDWIYNFKIDF